MSEFVLPIYEDCCLTKLDCPMLALKEFMVWWGIGGKSAPLWRAMLTDAINEILTADRAERDARHTTELAIINGQAEGFAIAASSEASRLKAEIVSKDAEIALLTMAPDPMRVEVRLEWRVKSEVDIRLYVGKVEVAVVFKSTGKWRFWFYIWSNRDIREEFDIEAEARAALLATLKVALTGEPK